MEFKEVVLAKPENIIDVSWHPNPFDMALMKVMEIYHSGDDDLDTVLTSVEVHGLSVNESVALFTHLHDVIEEDTVYITIEGNQKLMNDYITVYGNRKSE